MRARTGTALVAAIALVCATPGCRRSTPQPVADAGPPPASQTPDAVPRSHDFVANLSRCEARHRGQLLDLGSPAVDGLEGWDLSPDGGITSVEREGATWARVSSRSVTYHALVDDPSSMFVSARIRGLASRSATVSIDGKSIGTLTFTRGQTRVVSTGLTQAALAPGLHALGLRFSGSSRDASEPFAEIDWLRVGVPDDDPSAYAAPTLRDITENVAFQGIPRRAISLRAPSHVRCTIGVPPDGRLRVAAGLQGAGEGEAQIRVLRDGEPPTILKTLRVLGGDHAVWTDLDLPLDAWSGKLATIELAATSAARGARVVFGDPAVVGREMRTDTTPKARAVIVVVLSSIDPAKLPPWADTPLPTFAALAREGAVFERHRSPTTVTAAVLASLLTGLSPRQHGLEDAYARLPEMLPTLATVARDASVRTVMATSNPATFEAFGFARGWDRFVPHAPNSPALGTAPIDDLIAWIGETSGAPTKAMLGVAHTRGIHPPFDLSPGEFSQLPPSDYSGPLDPRRAGQVLDRVRQKRVKNFKWSDADRTRLAAMIDAALVQTDRSLSNLVDALRKAGLWNDTLLVVTSDVASATDPNAIPFAESLDLSEDVLRVPLYVHFPGGALAGVRVDAPTTAVDVARTVIAALDLEMPAAATGYDLYAIAQRGITPIERPLVATLVDRFATRWGDLRLAGRDGAQPLLFDLAADPHAEKDLEPTMPLTTLALWRTTWDDEAKAREAPYARPKREPATIDPDLASAIAVWGR